MRIKARQERWLFAACVFLACGVALAWPWLSGRVTIPWDAKAHFYPQFAHLARAIAAHDGVGWTPNVFAGSPQIADPQSLIFAPFYHLAALFFPSPSFALADGVLFAMLAAGGFGLFLYFQDRGWGAAGALVAALSFAFGGAAAWRLQHVGQVMSLAWFPLALFALSRALDRGSLAWGALAGALAGCMAAGRDQVAWLQTLMLTGFAVWRLFGGDVAANARRFVRPLAGGMVAGIAVAGLPVLFTLALAAHSNRPELALGEVVKGSLHPASLLTLFSANLFGVDGPLALFWGPPSPAWGETNLFLARNMGTLYLGALPVAAIFAARWRGADRDILYWAIAAIALAAYALGRYTPAFEILFRLPGADLWRRPADAAFPLCAILSLLGGYGVHRIVDEGRARIGRALLVVLLALGAGVWVAVDKGRLGAAAPVLTLASGLFLVALAALGWARRSAAARPRRAIAALGLLLAVDLAISNGPNESTALPPADFDMLRPRTDNTTIALLKERLAASAAPDRRDRVELAALGFAWPNAGMVHGFDHDLGYNPIRLDLFSAFANAQDHVALPEQRTFSKAFPSYRSIAADLMGLRYIATGVPAERIDPRLRPGDLNFVARTADAYVYENPRAFPRVFVAAQAQRADFAALLRAGDWPDVDYRRTVLVEGAGDAAERRPATARLARYSNVEIVVDLDAPDGGFLVLSDIYHPWWFASVDGVETRIERANVAFRAVRLKPGAKQVRFRFDALSGLFGQMRTEGVLFRGAKAKL